MRAAKLRVVKPSASYELMLPDDICEQSEGNVSSFWVQGGPLLLQLSSYLRAEGEQVPAETRLSERMVKHSEKWSTWKTNIYADPVVDQATAHFTDENGTVWIHAYLVWPHLTVYATISGPEELTRNQNNWAVQGLRSIRLVRHQRGPDGPGFQHLFVCPSEAVGRLVVVARVQQVSRLALCFATQFGAVRELHKGRNPNGPLKKRHDPNIEERAIPRKITQIQASKRAKQIEHKLIKTVPPIGNRNMRNRNRMWI